MNSKCRDCAFNMVFKIAADADSKACEAANYELGRHYGCCILHPKLPGIVCYSGIDSCNQYIQRKEEDNLAVVAKLFAKLRGGLQ